MPMAIHWHSKVLVVSFVGKINRLEKALENLNRISDPHIKAIKEEFISGHCVLLCRRAKRVCNKNTRRF